MSASTASTQSADSPHGTALARIRSPSRTAGAAEITPSGNAPPPAPTKACANIASPSGTGAAKRPQACNTPATPAMRAMTALCSGTSARVSTVDDVFPERSVDAVHGGTTHRGRAAVISEQRGDRVG